MGNKGLVPVQFVNAGVIRPVEPKPREGLQFWLEMATAVGFEACGRQFGLGIAVAVAVG